MTTSQSHGSICAGSYTWYGRRPPHRPKCDNGHRGKIMRYRIRSETWICDRCHNVMTDADNLQRPVNVKQEYRFLAGSAQEFAYQAIYDHSRHQPHSRVYGYLKLANRLQANADAYYREHTDILGRVPYPTVAELIDSTANPDTRNTPAQSEYTPSAPG